MTYILHVRMLGYVGMWLTCSYNVNYLHMYLHRFMEIGMSSLLHYLPRYVPFRVKFLFYLFFIFVRVVSTLERTLASMG